MFLIHLTVCSFANPEKIKLIFKSEACDCQWHYSRCANTASLFCTRAELILG